MLNTQHLTLTGKSSLLQMPRTTLPLLEGTMLGIISSSQGQSRVSCSCCTNQKGVKVV